MVKRLPNGDRVIIYNPNCKPTKAMRQKQDALIKRASTNKRSLADEAKAYKRQQSAINWAVLIIILLIII
jgi:hypothetical protein